MDDIASETSNQLEPESWVDYWIEANLSSDQFDTLDTNDPMTAKYLEQPSNAEVEYYREMPSLQISKDLDEMRAHLFETQQRSERVMSIIPVELPEVSADLAERFDQIQISLTLVTAMEHNGRGNLREAKREIKRAMGVATSINDEISIARCYYWIGRIEVERNNLPIAYEYFMNARPCVMSEKYPEGHNLKYYLDLTRFGNDRQYRHPLDHDSSSSTKGGVRREDINTPRGSLKKRKQDSQVWDLVMRPTNASRHTVRQQRVLQKPQESTSRTSTWILRSTEDVLHPNGTLASVFEAEADSNQLGWLQTFNARYSPPKRRYFTFRCYPRGLAPRTRRTEIFSEQLGEHLLSANAWAHLRERTKNRKITLKYLADEMLEIEYANRKKITRACR